MRAYEIVNLSVNTLASSVEWQELKQELITYDEDMCGNLFEAVIIELINRDVDTGTISTACLRILELVNVLEGEIFIKATKIVLRHLTNGTQYERAASSFRKTLINYLWISNRTKEALEMIMSTPVERADYSIHEKAEIYLEIVHLSLDCQDLANAEKNLGMVQNLYSQLNENSLLCYNKFRADILFKKKKYIDSGFKYLSLLTNPEAQNFLKDDTLILIMEKAVLSAIFSPIGKRKKTILGALLQQSSSFPSISPNVYEFMDRMRGGLVLPVEQENGYLENLARKHLMTGVYPQCEALVDLTKSIIEHNMTVLSSNYESISVNTLARLLCTNTETASDLMMNMIHDEVIEGELDLINGLVILNPQQKQVNDKVSCRDPNSDTNINYENICSSIASAVQSIKSTHPEWYQEHSYLA